MTSVIKFIELYFNFESVVKNWYFYDKLSTVINYTGYFKYVCLVFFLHIVRVENIKLSEVFYHSITVYQI